jgi:hypothetical protein
MKPRTTIRTLLASALVAAVTLVPATAWAGCTFKITPASPGWRGASAYIEGFGMSPDTEVYPKFNGQGPASGTFTNGSGYFKYSFTIPNDAPSDSNWVVFASGCQMDDARNYTVLATAPTTTTVTTTTTTTTTSVPPTTTLAPTTTVAATTTTVVDLTTTTGGGAETTTSVGDTTTTTVVEDGEAGDSSPILLYVIIGALAAAVLFLLARMMGGRRK